MTKTMRLSDCLIVSKRRPKYKNGLVACEKRKLPRKSIDQSFGMTFGWYNGTTADETLGGKFVYAHALSIGPKRCRIVFNRTGKRMTDSELLRSELIPASEAIRSLSVCRTFGAFSDEENTDRLVKSHVSHIIDKGIVSSYTGSSSSKLRSVGSSVEIKTSDLDILPGRVAISFYSSKWLIEEIRDRIFPSKSARIGKNRIRERRSR